MREPTRPSRRDLFRLAATGATLVAAQAMAQDAAPAAPQPELLPKVPRRPLGKTGATVPILLMGGGRKFDSKYDKVLHRAFEQGVDYIDTALSYADGQSHATVATFVEQVGRDKLWLTSKSPSEGATAQSYTADLDKCLSQLRVAHLDLYFMHAVDDLKFLEPEYIKMGEALKKSGKTRFFGFSCHDGNVVALMNKAAEVGGIDAIMFRYNFSKYGDLELNKAIDKCKQAGIGLIAMKTQRSIPPDHKNVVAFKSKQFSEAQAKLKAVWADERIDCAVSHMENTTQMRENVTAARNPVQLSLNEFMQLQQLATATAHLSCEGCHRRCESQVQGEVAIAKTLRYLMYKQSYGDTQKARDRYQRLSVAQRHIEGVDFSRAAAACPQGIDIAARLRQAKEALT